MLSVYICCVKLLLKGGRNIWEFGAPSQWILVSKSANKAKLMRFTAARFDNTSSSSSSSFIHSLKSRAVAALREAFSKRS